MIYFLTLSCSIVVTSSSGTKIIMTFSHWICPKMGSKVYKIVLYQVQDIRNLGFDNHNAGTSLLVKKADVRKGRMDIKIQTIETDIKREEVRKDESQVRTTGDKNARTTNERVTEKPRADDLRETEPATI